MEKRKLVIYRILSLAFPLWFSALGFTVKQLVNAFFLARYSTDALAAIVPASMVYQILLSPANGIMVFAKTYVAHSLGAKQKEKAIQAIIQGLYIAVLMALIALVIPALSKIIISSTGHGMNVQAFERNYIDIMAYGTFIFLSARLVAQYYIGSGQTRLVMMVEILGFIVNVVLDWILILGIDGSFRLGIRGAALAAVFSEAFMLLLLMACFYRECTRMAISLRKNLTLQFGILRDLVRFGIPHGIKDAFQVLAATFFVIVVGRIGEIELASTNLALSINNFICFPILGISTAVGILVGHSQGAGLFDESKKATYIGLFITTAWVGIVSVILLLLPNQIFALFKNGLLSNSADIANVTVTLIRILPIYTLFEVCSLVFLSALVSAGDTKWVSVISVVLTSIYMIVLSLSVHINISLLNLWTISIISVFLMSIVFAFRFTRGKWQSIKVVMCKECTEGA